MFVGGGLDSHSLGGRVLQKSASICFGTHASRVRLSKTLSLGASLGPFPNKDDSSLLERKTFFQDGEGFLHNIGGGIFGIGHDRHERFAGHLC